MTQKYTKGAVPFVYFCVRLLRLNQPHSAAIAAGTYGEVEPVGALGASLQQQLVEVLVPLVTDVEQDGGVAYELLDASHADVDGAARQVVAGRSTAHGPVHLRTPVPAVDDDRLLLARSPPSLWEGLVEGSISPRVKCGDK